MSAISQTPVVPSELPVTFTWSDGSRAQRMAKPIGYGITLILLVALYLATPALFPHADRNLTLSGLKAGALVKIAGFLVLAPFSPLLIRKAYLRTTPLVWTVEPGRFVADWGRGGRWEGRAADVRLAVGTGDVRPPHKKRATAGKPVIEVFQRGAGSFAAVPIGGIDEAALGRALAARGFEVAGVAVTEAGGTDVTVAGTPLAQTAASEVSEVRFPVSRRDRQATYKLMAILLVVLTPIAAVKFHDVRYLWAVPVGAAVSPAVAWLYDRERAEMTFSGTGVRGIPRKGSPKAAYEHVREVIGGIAVTGTGAGTQIVVRGLDGTVLRRQGVDAGRADEVRGVCAAFSLPFDADGERKSDGGV